jgi:hypothetical protein
MSARRGLVLATGIVSVLLMGIATVEAQNLPLCSSGGLMDCHLKCNGAGQGSCEATQLVCNNNGTGRWYYTCTGHDEDDDPIRVNCDSCSSGGGCFLAGTPITMADGSIKPIEKVQAGDTILAFDEITKSMKPDKVKAVHDPVEVPYYLVVNGAMQLTPNHRVRSKGEWIEIGKLEVGDTLTAPDGSDVPIQSIKRIDEKVTVYNFAVNPFETYVANGVIVHNKKHETQPPPEP